jgi:hypothetical protein
MIQAHRVFEFSRKGVILSTRDLSAGEITQIPPVIEELWKNASVFQSEDSEAYKRLWLEIAKSLRPTDIIEWLWIKDVLDFSWEIFRLRRVKAEFGPDFGFVQSDHFRDGLERYKVLDALLAASEARRIAVLREIERRRHNVASRLRRLSDDIVDGEFTKTVPACAPDQ